MDERERGHRMWGGTFTEPTDPRIVAFTASFATDRRLLQWDLAGSIAHAMMLGETGIIPAQDTADILAGLRSIAADAAADRLPVDGVFEDVHSFIEAALYARVGDAAGRLHTARSRNDQVLTAFRLFAKQAAIDVVAAVLRLMESLRTRAAASIEIILPAFTHLQHAQPVRLGHYLLAQFWALARDTDRFAACYRRADVLPLGAGAVAGVPYPIDRRRIAQLLSFSAISDNSIDTVGDRDCAVELAAAVALLMVHLSRWSGEIVLWATDEFGYVRLPDRVAAGSSIMPQKKNPDAAELIRGRAGRAIGDLVALLSMLKGLPSGYHSDLQEDKAIVFGAVDLALSSVQAMTILVDALEFDAQRMRDAAGRGWMTATDVADYLVRKGVPFRDAHRLAGAVVQEAAARGQRIDELPMDVFQSVSPLFDTDVLAAVTVAGAVNARETPGGTGRAAVLDQLAAAQAAEGQIRGWLEAASAALAPVRALLEG
ncbi:MAG TPA: argininosuccinate lyase [bacterium]|nr:argininosuccinate lyase [bacterium]